MPFTGRAFTLAEVLITLGIIGVVASITIPILMNNVQDQQFKTAYKKAYSVASQAWQSAYADNMMGARTGWVSESVNNDNFNQFMSKFSIIKTCKGPSKSILLNCWTENETSDTWWGAPFVGDPTTVCFIDKSGMSWCNGAGWAEVYVDTNGLKQPNQYGLDRFVLFPSFNNGGIYGSGVPNVLRPQNDFTTKDDNQCPSGDKHPCYYKKWLYN